MKEPRVRWGTGPGCGPVNCGLKPRPRVSLWHIGCATQWDPCVWASVSSLCESLKLHFCLVTISCYIPEQWFRDGVLEAERPGFKFWFFHSLPGWPWANCLTPPSHCFTTYEMGVIVRAVAMRLFGRVNEIIHVKHLEQCPACSKWSIHRDCPSSC